MPFYVADSQGYFAAEGLAIKINELVGGHRTLQQVLDGTADLATSSEAVVMFNSFRRNDYAVIATFVTSDDDVKVITRADTGITRPGQLAGKRIATVPGARMLPKSGAYVETFNLIVHKKHRGVRDDDLVKLLRALERAQQFITAQPLKAQAILRDHLQLDQSFIDWIWPRFNYRLALDQSLLTTLEGEARWARQEGHVNGERSPNYLDFIYSSPLRKAHAAAVSIDD